MNKRLSIILIICLVLLLIPLIAMQFTDKVNWRLLDFILAAFLLFGTGLVCDYVLRKVKKTRLGIAIVLAIIILLVLVWAELAVGIFGTALAGN